MSLFDCRSISSGKHFKYKAKFMRFHIDFIELSTIPVKTATLSFPIHPPTVPKFQIFYY
jgi:hypothetical protein